MNSSKYFHLSMIGECEMIHKEICSECLGSGTVACDCTGGCGSSFADEDCFGCGGIGTHICPACDGSGEQSDVDY